MKGIISVIANYIYIITLCFGIAIPHYAWSYERPKDSTPTQYKDTPQSTLRKIGIKTRDRLKRVYKSLLGSEECTSNEIILSRLLFLLLAAEVYIHAKSQWYEFYTKSREAIKSMEARKRMEAERKERLAAHGEEEDGEECFICLEKGTIVIPCPNRHPAKTCRTCLNKLYEPVDCGTYGIKEGGVCPFCRGKLRRLP